MSARSDIFGLLSWQYFVNYREEWLQKAYGNRENTFMFYDNKQSRNHSVSRESFVRHQQTFSKSSYKVATYPWSPLMVPLSISTIASRRATYDGHQQAEIFTVMYRTFRTLLGCRSFFLASVRKPAIADFVTLSSSFRELYLSTHSFTVDRERTSG